MANLSKERRDRMIAKLEELKLAHNDDDSIAALNEIENALREKKYGLVWEEHSEEVDELLEDNIPVLVADEERRLCKDENLPWNFIIEGDNLQALYLLEKTHRGKVDCIYIDPPYNNRNRSWIYNNNYVDVNDGYPHSMWLSLMKKRLSTAKNLLNPKSSVLICTIDEKEYLHLGCLLEELFPEARMQMISTVINTAGSTRNLEFSRTDEYIFVLNFGDSKPIPQLLSRDWLIGKNTNQGKITWDSLKRAGSGNGRTDSPGCFYPIFVDKEGKRIVKVGDVVPDGMTREEIIPPSGTVAIWPIRDDSSDGRWQQNPENLRDLIDNGYVRLGRFTGPNTMAISYLKKNERSKVEDGFYTVVGYREDGSIIVASDIKDAPFIPGTQWNISTHNAKQYGSILLSEMLGKGSFEYPKSLYAVHDIIKFFVSSKPDACVLDFFAGSGTTLHAVNLLNKEDNGKRRCVLITNNEMSEKQMKRLNKKGLYSGDPEYDKYGVAQAVTWPRTVCSIEGKSKDGKALKKNYLYTDFPKSDGFNANVKYFKCDWTPRMPEDYFLSNALLLHVKELIELQTASEIDGVKNVIIYSKSDYNAIFGNPESAAAVENVWVNENILFSAPEMKILREKNFKYIPREFFSQELKEVGEYV